MLKMEKEFNGVSYDIEEGVSPKDIQSGVFQVGSSYTKTKNYFCEGGDFMIVAIGNVYTQYLLGAFLKRQKLFLKKKGS